LLSDSAPKLYLRGADSRVRRLMQKSIAGIIIHSTSPPAAKLGAGVEKSPGPSLFYGFFARRTDHSCNP
jgi:hypothetical protein